MLCSRSKEMTYRSPEWKQSWLALGSRVDSAAANASLASPAGLPPSSPVLAWPYSSLFSSCSLCLNSVLPSSQAVLCIMQGAYMFSSAMEIQGFSKCFCLASLGEIEVRFGLKKTK